jgi:transposase
VLNIDILGGMSMTKQEKANYEHDVRLATNVGRVKAYLDAGYSITDIATRMRVGESSVRAWVGIIEEAKKNGYEG